MKYLYEPQYYADRYDLFTIERCLREVELLKKVVQKMRNAPELKQETDEEIQRGINYVVNSRLLDIELNEYKRRDQTIEEWIERDRKEQDAQDNTPPPENIKCDKCGSTMKDSLHHLHHDSNQPIRVLFFFDCPECKSRKAVFDDGEEWIYKPDLCKKCGSELKTKTTVKDKITTWTTTCTGCDYKDIDIMDSKKDELERQKKEAHDKELLEKYRAEYCLSKEEAEKWLTAFEELNFANEVYEQELLKHSDSAYEKFDSLKKLNISELEQTIKKELTANKYDKLVLKEPSLGKFVEVEFTLQDIDTSRDKRESVKQLEKLLTNILVKTNWRLTSSGVIYRLGYLVGRLKGYEEKEDLLKLLGKKEVKPKPLDPELDKKYGHSNSVQLYKFLAEQKSIENARMKRLELEPDGFLLEDATGGNYSCNICRISIRGSETWWTPKGLFCLDCYRNIKNGVIPIEVTRNFKIAFHKWDIEQEFGLHSATVNKLIRHGELIGRDLKDEQGKTYYTVFMAEDNVNFFKTHPRVREHKQRWHYMDKDGEVVWL